MPKYANSNSTVVTIGSLRIEPGQTVTTTEFIPGSLPTGITEVSSLPSMNPVLISSKLTSTGDVTVPDSYVDSLTGKTVLLTGNYTVSVYVATGECTLQFNGSGVVRYLGVGQSYSLQCLDRIVDTINIAIASSCTAYVTVEKC